MGILNATEFNNPLSYRENGLSQIIFRSGGGAYDRRVQTVYELSNGDADLLSEIPEIAAPAGDHAEYFIEDLEIDSVVAPNQNTRVALGTNVKFKVIEPYSMGKFIESLVIAAQDSGFKNYTHAPFCLRIDFTGWEYFSLRNIGNLGTTPAYIPIQIVKMDFQVTDQGSVYEVEAVVYNDGALADHINETKTPITIHGKNVAELLSDVASEDSLSLTKVLNDRIEDLEEENKINVYDRFVIMFPTDVAEMTEQLSTIGTTDSTSQSVENTDEEITVNTNISVFESVKSISISTEQINEIGNSLILDGKDCPIQKMVISEGGAIDRSESSYKNPLVKQFEYSQYDRITNIIEDIITRSEYASQEDDGSGFKKWFRIQTKILLDPNPEIIDQLGRPAKVYVFMVTPYITHEGKLVGP